jgi:lysine decarboxylase
MLQPKGNRQTCHNNGMKVLVDEAHGAHFYFGENLPVSAMAAGADMAAVSMHKTGGS